MAHQHRAAMEPQDENIIQVRDLTKRFDGFTAVDHVSFDVKRGEVFAFLGPNGAGKTTTIRMLTTLLKPTGGEMCIDGVNPIKDQDAVRRSFGIVFQDPSLDEELTAYENMEFHAVLYKVPGKERRRRVEEMLRFVDLWDRRGDLVKTFSGGMRRRLEVSRGLLHHPKILFLDEPTLGLDPQTRNHIWTYILGLNDREKITVFLTTHYMDEADRVAQRVAIIDHGRIAAIGSPGDLERQTDTSSLEDAFLAITGYAIREEEMSAADQMREMGRRWRRRR